MESTDLSGKGKWVTTLAPKVLKSTRLCMKFLHLELGSNGDSRIPYVLRG
jgi:hypothetical protein